MRASLASLVEEFRRQGAETAVVEHRGVRRYATPYGELAELAGRFAAELERRGVGPGERVVLWGENSAEWVGVFFGCLLRGVIVVPLDAAGDAGFAARVVEDVGARLVVGDGGLLAGLALSVVRSPLSDAGEAAAGVGNEERSTKNVERLELRGIGGRLPKEAVWAVSEAVGPDTPFQIVFTSGTTREPRGVVHTHRNVLVTLEPIEREMAKYRRWERLVHPLRFLHSLPLSHVFGQFMGLWCPALLGAEVHFADQLEPGRMVELIRRERVSVLVAVPRVLELLRGYLVGRFGGSSQLSVGGSEEGQGPMRGSLHSGGKSAASGRDDGSVRGGGSGRDEGSEEGQGQMRGSLHSASGSGRDDGSVRGGGSGRDDGFVRGGGVWVAVRKWWRWRRVHRALGWKFWAVISGGATLPAELEGFWNEVGVALIQGYGMTETTALVTLNHPFHIKEGTIGKALPGREVRLGEDGEILVRGETLSKATWERGAMRPREGEWLATGDLAERSESGELRFVGRKSDVIVTAAGMNVHPGDLEAALAGQAGMRGAVVVGCEFAAGPEAVAAVLFAGTEEELRAAVEQANAGLAEYQQIRHVVRWPELEFPYTSTGKVVRRKVKEWVEGRMGEGVARSPLYVEGSEDGGDGVWGVVAEVAGKAVTGDGLRLAEDLGMDSLGRVQLQTALEERFDVELDEDALAAVGTVGELREMVEENVVRSTLSVGSSRERQSGGGTLAAEGGSAGAGDRAAASFGELRTGSGAPGRIEAEVYPRWAWWGVVRAVRVVWVECVMRPLVWVLAKPRVIYVTGEGTNAGRGEARDPFVTMSDTNGINPGPVLIVANHVTAYDGALVLYALPGRVRRRVAAAMSGEMLMDFRRGRGQGNRVLDALAPGAWLLLTALFNVFPLPRARGFRRSFRHAGEAMDRGYSVLIFPEGSRSRDGRMHGFRPGIGLLAAETGAAVLPVGLRGLYDYASERSAEGRRRRWFHAGRVEVRVGGLLPAVEEGSDAAEATAQIERAVRELVGAG